jgi:hypothetical protein
VGAVRKTGILRAKKALPTKVFHPKDAVAACVFEVLERRCRDWIFLRLEKVLSAEVFLRLKSDTGSVPLLG